MGILFRWKIEKVLILPFGGITIFHEDLNRPIKEEFFIVIMGPIFQIVFTLIVYYFFRVDDFVYYSLIILGFNLLPIFPLDGSKILSLLFNKAVSFKGSHLWMILISILSVLILIMEANFSLILFLICLFLIMRVIREIKEHESLFNRFLLERYLKRYHFKKRMKISSMDMKISSMDMRVMRRDYGHLFFDGKKYISEGDRLSKRFFN